MKDEVNKRCSESGRALPRKSYETPSLRLFGTVTEVTRNLAGSCKDDGISHCLRPNLQKRH